MPCINHCTCFLSFFAHSRHSDEYQYSFVRPFTSSASDIKKLERIDEYSERDIYGANYVSTQKGRFFYQLSENPSRPTFTHAGYECSQWLAREEVYAQAHPIDTKDAQNCPTNRAQLTPIILQYTELYRYDYRADSRFAPSQWETSLQGNAISHWLDTNLESALDYVHLPWCVWITVSQQYQQLLFYELKTCSSSLMLGTETD